MNELALVESNSLREEYCTDRNANVLYEIGDIVTLGDTHYITKETVAAFYRIPMGTLDWAIKNNKGELIRDGYKLMSKKELENLDIPSFKIPNRGLALFTRRSMLRMGMLLRDSEIAVRVRTYLLNIEQQSATDKQNLRNMANQLSYQATELVQHANALTHNAKQLELQANLIKAVVNEINRNKEGINDLARKYQSHEERIADLEMLFHRKRHSANDMEAEFITPSQVDILKRKVKSLGDKPITIWRQFNREFGISRYLMLTLV